MSHSPAHRARRFWTMLGLVVAGEAVFALPFHIARFFRPSVLEVFQLSNTELGAAQGVYGIMAMLAYFPGGPLADRFPARKLMAASLWCTAAGGLYMSTFPGFRGALLLWGLFGVSTILLFWAALIRATREWGGTDRQGQAYGLLDGGRGLLAAVLATLAVGVFGLAFPEGYAAAGESDRREALRIIILGYTAATALAGMLVWFVIRDGGENSASGRWNRGGESAAAHIGRTLKIPAVWLQSVIIVCAYVGYKGFDNYSLYAVQGYGLDEVDAAAVAAMGAWMRPVAALFAGLLGDRLGVGRMTLATFLLLLASHLVFALDTPSTATTWLLFGNTLVTCAAIFGLRGLYFALFQEARVPLALTGTAVGLVSVVGYTPDIFVAWFGGMLLDRSPGLAGHQDYFTFLAAFSLAGVVASAAMLRLLARQNRAV